MKYSKEAFNAATTDKEREQLLAQAQSDAEHEDLDILAARAEEMKKERTAMSDAELLGELSPEEQALLDRMNQTKERQ